MDARAGANTERGVALRIIELDPGGPFRLLDDCSKSMPATVVAVIKHALGIELLPHRFASPPAPQGAAAPIDPVKLGAGIIAAGKRARAEIPPSAPADPVAAGIVRAGRRARNEADDD
jgi:hypothetical protein